MSVLPLLALLPLLAPGANSHVVQFSDTFIAVGWNIVVHALDGNGPKDVAD
jgi:hypothetical protein